MPCTLSGVKSPLAPFGKGLGDFQSDLSGRPLAIAIKSMKVIQYLFLQSIRCNSQACSHAALRPGVGCAIQLKNTGEGEEHAAR
jgi:hypothetical protein